MAHCCILFLPALKFVCLAVHLKQATDNSLAKQPVKQVVLTPADADEIVLTVGGT
jgi:hypothetical protein